MNNIFRKTLQGKNKNEGGMNERQILEYLLSLPDDSFDSMKPTMRPELNKLLKSSLDFTDIKTQDYLLSKLDNETNPIESDQAGVSKTITQKDLKSQLENSYFPKELISIILKYTKTTIKAEYKDKIVYYTPSEFKDINCKNILKLNIYGVLTLKDPRNKFKDSRIKSITGNLVLIGDASEMFLGAGDFNGNLNNWDVSQVTNMSGMFSRPVLFETSLDDIFSRSVSRDCGYSDHIQSIGSIFGKTSFNGNISNWDTSKVTDMSSMFRGATHFNQNIGDWDTSKVTNMSSMFREATSFNQDISNWITSKVTDMSSMFIEAVSFDQNLDMWDIKRRTNMDWISNGANKFKGINKKSSSRSDDFDFFMF
jgi:surface protein